MVSYKCTKCSNSYKAKRDLKEHYDSEHLGIRFGCTLCGCCNWKKRNLCSNHLKTHQECKEGQIVTVHPQDGIYSGRGLKFNGPFVGQMAKWVAQHQLPQQAQPPNPTGTSIPLDPGFAVVPLQMVIGNQPPAEVHCGLCPEGLGYRKFTSVPLLMRHQIENHMTAEERDSFKSELSSTVVRAAHSTWHAYKKRFWLSLNVKSLQQETTCIINPPSGDPPRKEHTSSQCGGLVHLNEDGS